MDPKLLTWGSNTACLEVSCFQLGRTSLGRQHAMHSQQLSLQQADPGLPPSTLGLAFFSVSEECWEQRKINEVLWSNCGLCSGQRTEKAHYRYSGSIGSMQHLSFYFSSHTNVLSSLPLIWGTSMWSTVKRVFCEKGKKGINCEKWEALVFP